MTEEINQNQQEGSQTSGGDQNSQVAAGKDILADISIENITRLDVKELTDLCKKVGLSAVGRKKDLIEKLVIKKSGKSGAYTGQFTKCQFCGEKVRVMNTRNQNMLDGRILVIRSVRCDGKHRHQYPLTSIVSPDKS